MEDPLRLGKRRMQAVAEFVRHRQDIAPPGGEIEQHVRVHARHRVRAEGAAPLVGPDRGIDPVAVEEPARDLARLGGERAVRLDDQLARRGVGERDVLGKDGGGPIVVGELVDADQLRLEPVPPLRYVIAGAYRLDQRRDGLV